MDFRRLIWVWFECDGIHGNSSAGITRLIMSKTSLACGDAGHTSMAPWEACRGGWRVCRCKPDRHGTETKPIWTTEYLKGEVSKRSLRNGQIMAFWSQERPAERVRFVG